MSGGENLKIKLIKIRELLLPVLFLIVYFTPDFRFLPHYTWVLSFIGLIVLYSIGTKRRIAFSDQANRTFLIALILSSIFLGLIVPLVHFTFDFTYGPILLGIYLCLFRNILIVRIVDHYSNDNKIEVFIESFLNACIICVIFTIVFIVFPNFKEFWLNKVIVNDVSEAHANWAAYQYRYSVGGFAAFSYATLFSCAIVMSAYMVCVNSAARKELLRFVVMCIGGFFYGRVTIFAIAIGIFLIVMNGRNPKTAIKFMLYLLLGIAVLIYVLNTLQSDNLEFKVWANWAFSAYNDIFIKREITTYSIQNIMNNMYFVPELSTILFGDGLYTDLQTGRYYMFTDVGYMRLLVYGGFLADIIAFTPMLYMMFKIKEYADNIHLARMATAIIVLWIALEAKGESYYRIILLMYPIFLLVLRRKKDEFIDKYNNVYIQ